MCSEAAQNQFEQLRQTVLHSVPLQRRLRDMCDKSAFFESVVAIGAELGLALTTAVVEAAMPPALRVPSDLPLANPTPAELRDWIPMEVSNHGSLVTVDWCYLGRSRFVQPFFEDTVRQRFRVPFSRMFRHKTSIDCVGRLVDSSRGIRPTGFIFHMSRCGSTLVSQMLATGERNIVISETPAIDSVLNLKMIAVDDDARARWLRWIIGALGQKRFDAEQYYFIKFDSWSTVELDVIRRTFPDVPWIFIYRDPVEVIVSQMRQRGSQTIPGALSHLLPEITLADALKMPAEEYCARILEKICQAAIDHAADPNALLVNYSQLPGAAIGQVLEHFGLEYDADEIAKMRDAANFNAKSPQLFFEPDSEGKRAEATEAARKAAERLEPVYCQLENLRLHRS